MATLPKSIQAQVDAANALVSPAAPQAAPEPPVEPTAPEPTAPSTPEVAPAAPVAAPAAPQDDLWERRYKSLQGLFNTEVPKLQSEVKELKARYAQAVESLEAAAKQPAQQPQEAAASSKDVEAFGQDLVDMVQRVVRGNLSALAAKVDEIVAKTEKRLALLEQTVQGTTQTVTMTAERAFFDQIARVVPDWEAVNSSTAFLEWLGQVDPLLGTQRQAALDQAQRSLDANRAIAVFQAFKATQPKAPTKPSSDKQVTPRSVASAPPAAPADKPVYTQEQVVAFYNAKRRGEYTAEQAAKYEQAINEAMAEGRIR